MKNIIWNKKQEKEIVKDFTNKRLKYLNSNGARNRILMEFGSEESWTYFLEEINKDHIKYRMFQMLVNKETELMFFKDIISTKNKNGNRRI